PDPDGGKIFQASHAEEIAVTEAKRKYPVQNLKQLNGAINDRRIDLVRLEVTAQDDLVRPQFNDPEAAQQGVVQIRHRAAERICSGDDNEIFGKHRLVARERQREFYAAIVRFEIGEDLAENPGDITAVELVDDCNELLLRSFPGLLHEFQKQAR